MIHDEFDKIGLSETEEKGERGMCKELGIDDVSDNTELESGSSNETSSTRNKG